MAPALTHHCSLKCDDTVSNRQLEFQDPGTGTEIRMILRAQPSLPELSSVMSSEHLGLLKTIPTSLPVMSFIPGIWCISRSGSTTRSVDRRLYHPSPPGLDFDWPCSPSRDRFICRFPPGIYRVALGFAQAYLQITILEKISSHVIYYSYKTVVFAGKFNTRLVQQLAETCVVASRPPA